jgi:hypothetical protein
MTIPHPLTGSTPVAIPTICIIKGHIATDSGKISYAFFKLDRSLSWYFNGHTECEIQILS